VNPSTLFLRTQCLLPDKLFLELTPFGDNWTSVESGRPLPLDVAIRNAGWHFVWLIGGYSGIGIALTAEAAIHKATSSALRRVKARFNAAERERVDVSRYLGVQVARVRLCERHIQEHAQLNSIDEITERNPVATLKSPYFLSHSRIA
jgi:hypothetical protein